MEEDQNKLRELVKRRCMKQIQIAEEIGITHIFFNTWIRGKREVSKKTADKILNWVNQ